MDLEKIYFLHHSGFVVETSDKLLVFDFYLDPAQKLNELLHASDKPLYFFVSHVHGDHFNPVIRSYEERAKAYILHEDCHLPLNDPQKLYAMVPGDEINLDGMKIHMYGSTDVGGSYMIENNGETLFHAGDLNWWHWWDETTEENWEARTHYFEELNKIKEHSVNFVFFPVDNRLQGTKEWGIMKWLERIQVKNLLIPMHAFGNPWIPSYEFRWFYPDVPLWIPQADGDTYSLHK